MRQFQIKDVLIDFSSDGWIFDAIWHHARVGRAVCVLKGRSLKIGDLVVYDDCVLPRPVAHNFFSLIGMPCRKQSFRGRGVGTALLNRVIAEAEQAGVSRLWGSVTASDIAETPHLLDWYRGWALRSATKALTPSFRPQQPFP